MVSWNKNDEINEEQLTGMLMEKLSRDDRANLKAANDYAKASLKQWFKDLIVDTGVSLLTPPGISTGKAIGEVTKKMLTSAYGGAFIRTGSVDGGNPSDSSPYNYLSNAFAAILFNDANNAEKELFVKWYVHLGLTVASVATGGFGVEAATHGAEEVTKKLIEVGIERGTDLAQDKLEEFADYCIVELITKDSKKDKKFDNVKGGAVTWAVYLAGEPRAPSPVENARLALRISMGMPITPKGYEATGNNFLNQPKLNKNPPSPKEVAELFKHMLQGTDTKDDYNRLKKFNSEIADGGHFHVMHLYKVLAAKGLLKQLKHKPFILK